MPAPDARGPLRPATIAVVAGRPAREPQAPVNPPVVLSSTFVGSAPPSGDAFVYTRLGTPAWEPLEEVLGRLEGADLPGVLFASGMAAIGALLALVPPGGVVVVPRHAYHTTLVAAGELAARSGVEVRTVDVAETEQVVAAVHGATPWTGAPADVLWVESPTNPVLEIADLAAVTAAAHEAGALAVVDSTFATPLAQRPLALGADAVVHSVTKYLSGHSDVVLGAVVTGRADVRAHLVRQRTVWGAVAGPWDAWLALRGIRTLGLRVERSQASALTLARRLEDHPAVVEVRHPGLTSHPQHARAVAQMTGFGSILTVRPAGGAAGADAVVDAVRLWVPATSLGGVESSLERRRRFPTESATVPEDLVRLSVGVEDVEDLWEDLDQALHRAGRVPRA